MIILSNCLSEVVDEGFIKVANSLVWRIKAAYPETTVISYERKSARADMHMQLKKFFLNPELLSLLRRKREPILYIPISSNGTGSIVRLCLLSLINKEKVTALFALRHSMNSISRILLKFSGVKIVVLSAESYDYFCGIVGDSRVTRLKTGVDSKKFVPADPSDIGKLRAKYGLPEGKGIVLHVGHMRPERNISCLGHLDEDLHSVLVLSSAARQHWDSRLHQELAACKNLTILYEYIPEIQEVYQLADVYLFPVQVDGACIDLPLSVLEAAACGTPVVCTDYGALKEFRGKTGFWFPESFESCYLNKCIKMALEDKQNPRGSILDYDWSLGIDILIGKAE